MAYNGSGTFTLAAGNPVVTGTTISSTWANNTLSDIATGLSTAITKDGQTTVTANLPMATFKHTGVGAATALTHYARADQTQNNDMTTLSSVAGTNTITGTATPTPSAYASGQRFQFVPAATNTGATTINVSSLGAKNVFFNGAACLGGELVISIPATVIYDGTQFHLTSLGNAPYLFLPQNSQSAAYTTVMTDANRHILHPTADNNPRTFTIDSNANVAYPVGTTITFVNQINTVTIAITSDTMTLAGTSSTGNRTLAANGMATAIKVASTAWYISGAGLS